MDKNKDGLPQWTCTGPFKSQKLLNKFPGFYEGISIWTALQPDFYRMKTHNGNFPKARCSCSLKNAGTLQVVNIMKAKASHSFSDNSQFSVTSCPRASYEGFLGTTTQFSVASTVCNSIAAALLRSSDFSGTSSGLRNFSLPVCSLSTGVFCRHSGHRMKSCARGVVIYY